MPSTNLPQFIINKHEQIADMEGMLRSTREDAKEEIARCVRKVILPRLIELYPTKLGLLEARITVQSNLVKVVVDTGEHLYQIHIGEKMFDTEVYRVAYPGSSKPCLVIPAVDLQEIY